ncbi:MAG TPA: MFS transporter [Steroidobacteraceae bacterium]|nr:MFS transporter [Steroidobacteraceae bacterium]
MSGATASNSVDIGKLIDAQPLGALQIRVILLCALIVILDGYDIQTLALTVPTLMKEWGLPRGEFGWALSFSLIGYGLGAAFLAGLGDRFGRKPVLIFAVLLMAVGSIGNAYVTNMQELIVWRFLTGVGFGTSIPNCTALTSEYMPAKSRALLITLMYTGVAFGALVSGFVADPIINAYGWRAIFVIGGALPLAISILLYAGLPESIRFLVARCPGDARTTRIAAAIAPGIATHDIVDHSAGTEKQSLASLLAPLYRPRTLLLWSVFALNLFVLYFLISWLPSLLTSAGWTPMDGRRGGVLIQAGGIVSGLLMAWGVDRGRTVLSMVTAYACTAVGLGLFLVLSSTGPGWWMLLFVIGWGSSGTQFALNALAAAFYPPVIRSTGIGWAVGIGRVGAILGPLAGSLPFIKTLPTNDILGLMVVPVILCAVCTSFLPRVWRG